MKLTHQEEIHMPVARCRTCGRGMAGYLDSEKELSDLTTDEINSEIFKLEAKVARIRHYMNSGTQQIFQDGVVCSACGHGWREFESHRKDLEQLDQNEARAALAANSRWLGELRQEQLNRTPAAMRAS